jgi:CSLREA domain-containing protein
MVRKTSSTRSLVGLTRASKMARPAVLVALLLVLVPVCVMLFKPAAKAHPGPNTITVDTLSDPFQDASHCSLRGAIISANTGTDTTGGNCAAGIGNNLINFSVSGTIELGSALPAIANSSGGALTIDGSNQTIVIDGSNDMSPVQIMVVNSGATLTLNDLTIENGSNSSGNGGAIDNEGTLTVIDSTLSGNSATNGGGIFNNFFASLTVANSTFSDNDATNVGGCIYNPGTLSVSNSTFSDNDATNVGGCIQNNGTLSATNSTFSGNSTGAAGGTIENEATLSVTNSTFSGNSATTAGGGIFNVNATTVTNVTFSGNSAATRWRRHL